MKIVTKRETIREVREKWLHQYNHYKDSERLGWCAKTAGQVRQEFQALDLETCSESDVDKVIGTSGWAAHDCDECREDKDVLVHLGDDPDYDARWQDICAECLQKAVDLCTEVATAYPTNETPSVREKQQNEQETP